MTTYFPVKVGNSLCLQTLKLSGWPCVARLGRGASSHDVICWLRKWFADVGVPSSSQLMQVPSFPLTSSLSSAIVGVSTISKVLPNTHRLLGMLSQPSRMSSISYSKPRGTEALARMLSTMTSLSGETHSEHLAVVLLRSSMVTNSSSLSTPTVAALLPNDTHKLTLLT